MKYPYFFGTRTSTGTVFFLLAILPSLSTAAEPGETLAPLSMYFDDSQMVEVATRAPKPMTQVAENVSIVTAEDIEGMHAQSLSEVLSRLPGVFALSFPSDFNGGSQVYIQGSREEHVLVLIDGVRLNSAMSGDASVNHLPLRIIERIEIIKGPASAAWGSSQGGVINILTKKTGSAAKPAATVSGSFGERQVAEYEADLAGKVGKIGYYLYAGQQDSNGLKDDRFYDSGRVYGKVSVELPRSSTLTFTGSALDPHYRTGDFAFGYTSQPDFSEDTIDRTHFLTANYDTPLSESLHLNLGARQYERTFVDNRPILPGTLTGTPGELFWKARWHEKSKGVNAHLSWQDDWQQVSLGGEMNRSEMGTTTDYGPWTQANWPDLNGNPVPAQYISKPGYEETWGLYLNDTMTFGRLAVTPGLRYDHHSISDSILSPSLGATYRLREDTLLRAMVSRGFQHPILSYITGGGIWDMPNPTLKPEIVTSWQMGVENRSLSFLSLKLDTFIHRIKDVWGVDNATGTWGNIGNSQRQGIEIEAATTPWHNLSLVANTTYALIKPEEGADSATTAANLILRYQDPQGWRGELAGQYIWWDTAHLTGQGQNQNLVWNANLGRTVYSSAFVSCDLYAKVYNLFDGAQDNSVWYQSPDRWVLAGMKLTF